MMFQVTNTAQANVVCALRSLCGARVRLSRGLHAGKSQIRREHSARVARDRMRVIIDFVVVHSDGDLPIAFNYWQYQA